MTNAFSQLTIPSLAKDAYNKTKDRVDVDVTIGGKSSHFTPSSSNWDYGKVVFYIKDGLWKKFPDIVARHEFGHAIDSNGRGALRSSDKSFIKLVQKANRETIMGSNIYDDVVEYVNRNKNDPSLSDFFSAITKNRIVGNYGHRSSYYENSKKRSAEVFANLFDMYARRKHYDWVKRKYPDITRAFKRILKETK